MENKRKKAMILKIKSHNPQKELEFELAYQQSLTTQQRFQIMFRRSKEIARMLLKNEYRKPFEIIKRP